MRLNVILRYVGMAVVVCAVFMLLSAVVAMHDGSFSALLLSAVVTLALGAFPLIFVERSSQITSKEAYVIVIMAWVVACFVGTFPFLLYGGQFDVAQAWFESVSGFTTTGATAISDVDALPRGLLFWRSTMHWMGGVGVIMFALVVLPSLGRNKLTLSSVELSSLARENYRYQTHRIAQIVLMLYIGMTLLATVALRIAGMGWFDAVNHAFSTIATGGFSTHTASIGYWDSAWIEGVTIAFMLLSGLHYGLLFATITGRHNNMFRSEVAKMFLWVILVASAAVVLSLWLSGTCSTLGEAARQGIFHVVATVTTTGFATADTTIWTPLCIAIMVYLIFQGGCAGSTSGGVKVDRIWLALKTLRSQITKQQHPSAVVRIKLNGIVQDQQIVNFAIFFIVLYLLIVAVGTMIVAATGVDLTTSFTMVAACMGNVGPGFGTVGTAADYQHVAPMLKVLCTVFMLLGRLEIFGFIQLFMIKWWR